MAFMFQCPQCANVLQAGEAQAGQQCSCPMCSALFVVPAPVMPKARPVSPVPGTVPMSPKVSDSQVAWPGTGAAPSPGPPSTLKGTLPQIDGPQPPTPSQQPSAELPSLPSIQAKPSRKAHRKAPQTGFQVKESDLLHIPCPKCRNVLETPVEMLHQDVVCPHCDTPFCLHLRDSQEYQRKKERQRKIRERRTSYAWLIWAIVVVALVIAFLGYLVMSSPSD